MLDKEGLMKFYNLKNLIRYNHRFRLVDETVAEHSYFVSLFTMQLCDYFEVDNSTRLLAVQHAIIHDIPEIEISDVPHSVKEQSYELSQSLKELEIKAINKLLPRHANNFKMIEQEYYSTELIQAHFIVKLADILSVLQYCFIEESLGNTHMEEVKETTYERLVAIEKQMETIFPSYAFPYQSEEFTLVYNLK